ncbi:F-box domain-containing protein [Stachybotrys elegans]|uniref:F-box domain-containing protein n=1 Tax=Stachybotrys elegans TaxID=80388 RepID=A0A8K0SXR4_9HYPO|nr:F-box domain-containing protein [Stachybotrys elegans]
MDGHSRVLLSSLPNEILAALLSHFMTSELLALARTNTRFYSLIARLIRRRLQDAACLPHNELILESYHPSERLSTPYLHCRFLGVRLPEGVSIDLESPTLADMNKMYSVFRPFTAREGKKEPTSSHGSLDPSEQKLVLHDVELEHDETFTQLCVVTNLVKEGPRRGLFLGHLNLLDDFVRVHRQWLEERATDTIGQGQGEFNQHLNDDGKTLWVDAGHNFGLRFQVKPGPAERMPLLTGPDDRPAMSYRLAYQELLVRSTKLLLSVEKSTVQEVSNSGSAVVIAQMQPSA